MSSFAKSLAFWLIAALVLFLFWSVSARINTQERAITFSDFMARLERNHIASVTISVAGGGTEIVGELRNGQAFRTFAPNMERLAEDLLAHGVDVRVRDRNSSSWVGHLISWTPIVIMIAFLIFFMRQMQSAATVSPITRLRMRQERRLEMKVEFFEALAAAKEGLAEDELLSLVSSNAKGAPQDNEARKALYEMLRDGTAEMTERMKYRLKTRS